MNLEKFYSTYGNSYHAYQVAKWLHKNLTNAETVQTLSEHIQKVEDSFNKEHQTLLNKCPHCKIDFLPADENTVECPRCGLADSNIVLKDYNKYTFDQEKHFTNCVNNILGITNPTEDILPLLRAYCTKNNISKKKKKEISIETLRLVLKQLNLTQYNKFTSYLYKKLTGNKIPFIPHDLIKRAKMYFYEFYKAREKLVLTGKLKGNNNPHYTFLVYKIFDLILDKKDKRHIVRLIHLPTDRTHNRRNHEFNLVLDQINL